MDLKTLQNQMPDRLIAIAHRHGASNVRVFDSVAKGEAGEMSDVDFLVDLDKGRDLFDLGTLQAEFEELLRLRVDIVESTWLHPAIRSQVLAECVVL
ncbi:MAG: nucleotidyltransferase domain-containing protein [Bryobacter sp.]|nr:nucleotidyltransferase domain-containing protein [Bryobacter sp.]